MKIRHLLADHGWGIVQRLAFLCALFALATVAAHAQAAAEYGAAASFRAAPITSMKMPSWRVNTPKAPPSKPGMAGSYLIIPATPPIAGVNRHALEKSAGKDAAKLMLRSVPTAARVWVNGKFVGATPALLFLPPGKYHLQFRGPRLESGSAEIALLPDQARELAVPLKSRYPVEVSIR